MSTISTHVLDTSTGRPAVGIRVILERDRVLIGSSVTDEDGRCRDLLQHGSSLSEGDYSLTFSVGDYFEKSNQSAFYSDITIRFRIEDEDQHYHVPLLLSPYGYSTYRGS